MAVLVLVDVHQNPSPNEAERNEVERGGEIEKRADGVDDRIPEQEDGNIPEEVEEEIGAHGEILERADGIVVEEVIPEIEDETLNFQSTPAHGKLKDKI